MIQFTWEGKEYEVDDQAEISRVVQLPDGAKLLFVGNFLASNPMRPQSVAKIRFESDADVTPISAKEISHPPEDSFSYTREKLIEICEKAIVPVEKWGNRDTPEAQLKVGQAWALLKAGCDFEVLIKRLENDRCVTDEETIWISIKHPAFWTYDGDPDHLDEENFYLPTEKTLKASKGRDWY